MSSKAIAEYILHLNDHQIANRDFAYGIVITQHLMKAKHFISDAKTKNIKYQFFWWRYYKNYKRTSRGVWVCFEQAKSIKTLIFMN